MANAIELLEEIRKLMEMKGENPFKVRAFEKAIEVLNGRTDLQERAGAGTLTELPGIGKGISEVLTEFLLTGKSTARDELAATLPAGLLEFVRIPGLGPKKAMQLIEELGIHSLAELEYACKENRLLKLKGFGEKAQHKISEGVRFLNSTRGSKRLDEAFPLAKDCIEYLLGLSGELRVSESGGLRRRMEVLTELDFLLELPQDSSARDYQSRMEGALRDYLKTRSASLPICLHFSSRARFGFELARTTGSPEHWKAMGDPCARDAVTEEEFYELLGFPWIPPEMRETGEEVKLARSGKIEEVLDWNGIQGVFHNHTTRSDGVATLEQMVEEARGLGFKYIGISDHSQSAFYAQGLTKDRLLEQEREVREMQEKYPDIRIFWGIESDILADGSLDYEPSLLQRFDFVVASIHSRFQMDRETMTQRILEAVRNPCTRFLGHATGRILLGRPGYDLNMEKVIEEAAKHDVAIEINASPSRLDIDWRWGPELRKSGTCVSVNPDAHDTDELANTVYGVAMARKALLPTSLVVNSRSVNEVEKWLKRQ